ncbi:MAG: hypothetical protein RIT45_631 [Pseudomonadota bacterium]
MNWTLGAMMAMALIFGGCAAGGNGNGNGNGSGGGSPGGPNATMCGGIAGLTCP